MGKRIAKVPGFRDPGMGHVQAGMLVPRSVLSRRLHRRDAATGAIAHASSEQYAGPSRPTDTPGVPTSTPQPAEFSGQRAYDSVVQQVALGPRITGSAANIRLGDQVLGQLSANGWQTQTQNFTYQGTPIRNLIGVKGSGKNVIILGAHYDTRRRADQDKDHPDQPVPGANDGASGVAVLLELSRVVQRVNPDQQVWLVFFDAEDNGELDGWNWIVGSTYFANSLTLTPTAVVVIDMIGDQQQELYLERNSNPTVANTLWDTAAGLGYGAQFIKQYKWDMVGRPYSFPDAGF